MPRKTAITALDPLRDRHAAVSGVSLDRPALRRLVKAVAAGQVEQIVVHRFDRSARRRRRCIARKPRENRARTARAPTA